MKKILIPIIGLLVLIILTPVILGKLSNSHIDAMIKNYQKNGVKIKQIEKNIGYLSSKRVFDVVFDKNTKIKLYKPYKNLLNKASFRVVLRFDNLPITSARFDIKSEGVVIKNKEYLKNLNIVLISKDLYNFRYLIKEYKSKNFHIMPKNGVGNIVKLTKEAYKFIQKIADGRV
jgi:hypothetical protein